MLDERNTPTTPGKMLFYSLYQCLFTCSIVWEIADIPKFILKLKKWSQTAQVLCNRVMSGVFQLRLKEIR